MNMAESEEVTKAKIERLWGSVSPAEKLEFLARLGSEENVAHWLQHGALRDVEELPVKVWGSVRKMGGDVITLPDLLKFMVTSGRAR